MKVKLTVSYLLAFLSLTFVINELHSWIHSIVAEWICDCWGTQGFEKWSVCPHCDIAENFLGIAWLAAPLLNYLIILAGWALMDRRNSIEKKSIGFALFFASVPLGRLFAVFTKGDEPTGLKEIFSPSANDTLINIILPVIIVLLVLPPLMRSMNVLKEIKQRVILVIAFALIPFLVIHFGVNGVMNNLLVKKPLQDSQTTGFSETIVIWGIFWLFVFLLTFRKLPKLLSKDHQRKHRRRHRKVVTES